MESIALLVAAALNAGTVLAIASLGLLVNERAGVVNLGAEGIMLVAAVAGFATAVRSGSDGLGLIAGAATGASLSAVFGVLVLWLESNQYATGLALSLFGSGLSAFVGQPYTQAQLGPLRPFVVPGLVNVPFIGAALGRHPPMVYATVALAAGLGWFLFRSRAGLVLRAIGDSPQSAHVLGYPVRPIRLAAIAFGGALAGVAGAYASVVYTRLWVEGMIAGRGWIALALTCFGSWRPGRVLLGAYLFGGVTMLQLHLQAEGVEVPSQLLSALPYIATIVVLAAISGDSARMRAGMPASLGKPFTPSS